MSTWWCHLNVWGTSQKDVKSLESAHKDMAIIIQDLPWGVVHAGVLIPLGWYSGEVTVCKKDTIY